MATLVIPDVHLKIDRVQNIIDAYTDIDARVFLGDWFDDYGDSVDTNVKTAEYLKTLVTDPKNTFLYGNHDIQYFYPLIGALRCSGYTKAKLNALMDYTTKLKPHFKLLTIVNDWYLTHAGIDIRYIDNIEHKCIETLNTLNNYEGILPSLVQAGWSRGGDRPVGGVTWLDWNDEFMPLDSIKQIVGHTHGLKPRRKGNNHCIDTDLRHYGIIDDTGKFEVLEYALL